ncbi:uridine kinase [Gulosibacter molinativorax]|uniref:Uridine kinase n=1 Tax=Gulosibacter molinativorax TaxID=256821 RepID=A0ABT7CD92_9MICO|nr:uridine kinase [Gulosibacter molinativorax]MDJ1372466.1 uridine kinase [Gulosibacter molinativorax]QUY63520.1 Uridine kinase [Gulosibacter molinativorax]
MSAPFVVGIAGGSGSGKTALARSLAERFGEDSALIFHDNYYCRRDELTWDERSAVNYDEPAAFETSLLTEHLDLLLAGQSIDVPVYDYAQHNRSEQTVRVNPAPIVFVEGVLVLYEEELRKRFDLKLFVETDADVRILRRIKRDVLERGRTIESVESQYLSTVKPMHERYVESSKVWADVIVPEGGYNHVALETIAGGLAANVANLAKRT